MINIRLFIILLSIISTNIFADNNYLLPNNQWRIISLPEKPPAGENTLIHIFSDSTGLYSDTGLYIDDYLNKWIVYSYDEDMNQYEQLTLDSVMEQGKGFWIIQAMGDDIIIQMPDGSINTPDNYAIQLTSSSESIQWNLSGNPFSRTIDLKESLLKTSTGICSASGCSLSDANSNGLLNNIIWTYNGNDYVAKDETSPLHPWDGFWVATLEGSAGQEIQLSFPQNNEEELSHEEIAGLLFMREEEELARDLYLNIYEGKGNQLRIFYNISSRAETKHAESIRVLLEKYGINDPSTGSRDTYNDKALQDLYDELLGSALGSNDIAALNVGALVEETDIRDINAHLSHVSMDHQDIISTYDTLLCGSRNHLRAFARQIGNITGNDYIIQVPELTAEVQAILNSDKERCGGGNQ
jgi:hypothetical protein